VTSAYPGPAGNPYGAGLSAGFRWPGVTTYRPTPGTVFRKIEAVEGLGVGLEESGSVGPLLRDLLRRIAAIVAAERAVVPPPTGLERHARGDEAGLGATEAARVDTTPVPEVDRAPLALLESVGLLVAVSAGDACGPVLTELPPAAEIALTGAWRRTAPTDTVLREHVERLRVRLAETEAALAEARGRVGEHMAWTAKRVEGLSETVRAEREMFAEAVARMRAEHEDEVAVLRERARRLEALLDDAEALALS